jgi:hypothetical protein
MPESTVLRALKTCRADRDSVAQDEAPPWQGGPHDSETVLFPAIIEADGEGFEPQRSSSKKSALRKRGGAESGAVGAPLDSDLARIVAAWPTLPEPIRRAMLALIGHWRDRRGPSFASSAEVTH